MKKIIYLTGTRADFGKLKSLINITLADSDFDVEIFATGMHMNSKYGQTVHEIHLAYGHEKVYKFINHDNSDSMDSILAKTIEGFSAYVKETKPDLIVVHGDRVEALAGAIVGSLNNILVAHFEGGEVSGTIDELIRHAVTKMSHAHFVSNESAKNRLVQMGEYDDSIFVVGSPDIDIMNSKDLPTIDQVRSRYDFNFESFGVLALHPVTTEVKTLEQDVDQLLNALIESGEKIIGIYPNNDHGTEIILRAYQKKIFEHKNFKVYSSLRFEYFLTLLKNAKFIIGNSSAGIREAPYYGVPTINIGTRQYNRSKCSQIMNCSFEHDALLSAIKSIGDKKLEKKQHYGSGNSGELFLEVLKGNTLWNIDKQKFFRDIALPSINQQTLL